MSKPNAVQLKDTMLSFGNEYYLEYINDGCTFEFSGVFTDWDALKDEFAFENSDYLNRVHLVVNGNDVLTIELDSSERIGESDPSGLDASQAGAKLDAGKIYADAIFAEMPRALWGVAECGTFGANKYSLGGWVSVEDGIRRYRDAAARHRLKRHMGETIDPDSGLPHTYHEAWNVLASLELELRQQEK